jgi:hypothetical protein
VTEDWFAESIVDVIEFEGPARAGICDQYDVLLISDEVICAWGRLGEWFGSERYDSRRRSSRHRRIRARQRLCGRDDVRLVDRRAVPPRHLKRDLREGVRRDVGVSLET